MTVLLPDLMDGADIGMVESRGGLCFPLKAGQGLGVLRDVIGQELQGDKAVQGYIFGLVNDAHPTAAQLFNNAVVRDGLSDQVGSSLCARS